MRRLLLSIASLSVCSLVAFATPQSGLAANAERDTCEECEYMNAQQEQMFCSGACENDEHFCGGAGQYCPGSGWDAWCVCVPEDFPCVDPCTLQ